VKKTLFTVVLFIVFLAVNGFTQTRWLSRYWDGCKPTCSWVEHAGNSTHGLCKVCNVNNEEVLTTPAQVGPSRSSCGDMGSAPYGDTFTCWDMIPFVSPTDPNVAYAYGATSGAACGTCFEVTFDGGRHEYPAYSTHKALVGKKVIIMGRNTGDDVSGSQIDFMVPGGGLGRFDSFSWQVFSNVNSYGAFDERLGLRYGGFVGRCEPQIWNKYNWDYVTDVTEEFQECVRKSCNEVFTSPNQSLLLQGCLFYADWMMAANNPTGTVRTNVECPQELIDRYKIGSGGNVPPPTGGGGDPNTPRYTITYNVNGGTGTAPDAQPVNQGSSAALKAGTGLTRTGFMFGGWNTNAAGNGTNYAAGESFTPTADVTLYARWIAVTITIDTIKVDGGTYTNSSSETFKVNSTMAGDFDMEFRLSGEWYIGFQIRLNGVDLQPQVGINNQDPQTHNVMQTWTFPSKVPLIEGENTIVLTFSSAVNIEYFQFIGETLTPVSVKLSGARVNKSRPNVVLRPANRGFTALLPNNHNFESYSLVDLQGREIRKGKIQSGASELYFSNVRQSVLFLRLKGKNGTTVLRVATF